MLHCPIKSKSSACDVSAESRCSVLFRPDLFAGFLFVANVHRTGWIVAHQNRGQMRHNSRISRENIGLFANLFANFRRHLLAINNRRCHDSSLLLLTVRPSIPNDSELVWPPTGGTDYTPFSEPGSSLPNRTHKPS